MWCKPNGHLFIQVCTLKYRLEQRFETAYNHSKMFLHQLIADVNDAVFARM